MVFASYFLLHHAHISRSPFTFALNFSRPAGQIIAQYYNFLRLGKEGYRRIQQACYDTAVHMGNEIDKLGPFEVIYNGKKLGTYAIEEHFAKELIESTYLTGCGSYIVDMLKRG